MYPVYTAIIMILFFHEKFSWRTAAAIVLAVAGVAFLSAVKGTGQNQHTAALGLILILAAGLIYAVYLVAIPQTEAGKIDSLALTFYVLLFGFIYLIISTSLRAHGLQPIQDWKSGINLLLLA
ncbi:MAG: EamA family transporter, partial [Bacteroidales bacterium]